MPSQKYDAHGQLDVGVVGLGRMGRHHALNILRHVSRANLVAACSPAQADLDWADDNLIPHGVRVTDTFEEMLETPGLDAVIIASVTHLHKSQTTQALQKGLHVLCEKPVCKSVQELEELVKVTEANPSARLMVGFVRRFDRDYKQAREQIKNNAIGRPIVIRSQACEIRDESAYYKQYLKDSGGIFMDSTIHDIDLSLFFMGEDSIPKSVIAVGVAAVHSQLPADGDADNAVGICEFWDGKIAFFYNSRTTVHGYDNATEIFGTQGKLSVNLIPRHNALELCDSHGLVKTFSHPGWYERYASAFVTEAEVWIDALLDNQPLPVPLRSSLVSLQIATALQKSLSTGQKIFFDEQGRPLDS